MSVAIFKCNRKHIEGATQRRQNTYRKGIRPPPDPVIPFHAWSDRSNADRFTYNL